MAQQKRRYKVYRVGDGTGCFASSRRYLGDTWAVSEAQACNNVRHRTGGGYALSLIEDCLDEGSVLFSYEAVLA